MESNENKNVTISVTFHVNVAQSPLTTMDTARLPTRLHEFYPLDLVPTNEIPQDGEEDFHVLHNVADCIIAKLKNVSSIIQFSQVFSLKDFARTTKKIFFLPNLW